MVKAFLVLLFCVSTISALCQNQGEQLTPKVFKANHDKEFDDGMSRITSIDLTPARIEDLALLGQTWGFLKYYHPAIAAGEYNWDYELFRIMPKIIEAQSHDQTIALLSEWISKLGPVEKGQPTKSKFKTKLSPDLSFINEPALGKDLFQQLIAIRDAKRTGINYYVELKEPVPNPIFTNETAYASMAYPDAGVRILSLFRYWNTIQYFFPYKNLIEENWNDVLKEFIPKFLNAEYEREYKLAVLEIICRIHDTHATLLGVNLDGNNLAPLAIRFIENQPVVTDYFNSPHGAGSQLKKGDVILSVNGKPI